MAQTAQQHILIKGARTHNLKNIDLQIPRGLLVVITGVSGSGKSSLAFDTLYAEGQRRYVESLSSYARQFMQRMNKPEVDFIKGIPPAIAIEQKVNTRNPHSTVGTSTEIYDYMKLLFARIGKTYSPLSGDVVVKHSTSDVLKYVSDKPEGTRFLVLSAISIPKDRTFEVQMNVLLQQGYSRILIDDELIRIEDASKEMAKNKQIYLIVDRIAYARDEDTLARITDSVSTAFFEGKNQCFIYFMEDKSKVEFSKRFELDGIVFQEPSEDMFSFNNPVGACPTCNGFGKVIGIDPDLVIPDRSKSVYDDCVVCWRGDKMREAKEDFLYKASDYGFPIHTPYYQLTAEQKTLLWKGNSKIEGIDAFFKWVETQQYKIQYRVMLARYRGKTICGTCKGARLKKEASFVKVGGQTMNELVLLPIKELKQFFDGISFEESEKQIAERLLHEIRKRIDFLMNVGLPYLDLNRPSNTLSGGESQRINLATSLGSSLVGSLYILDEPSIGLHSKDTDKLIEVLKNLRSLGNTVMVVEHDEDIIKHADYVIDIGPKAGAHGGEVVFAGALNEMVKGNTLTTNYLLGKERIEVPDFRRTSHNKLQLIGAGENNLKHIDVDIPLQTLTVVTGVSGSGKTSLIKKILYPALKRQLGGTADKPGVHAMLKGDLKLLSDVEFVDQNPIGKSSRSNPVTYLKAYDEIRTLFSNQQYAKINGFKPAHFSFNVDGGRCDECQGEGYITIEMQFMADVTLLCESCNGKRFKKEVLDVKYKGKSIHDVLEMTVNESIDFFKDDKKVVKRLKPLQDVGLGYVKLGQSSSTLSGGESQRVKLAYFLSKEKSAETMFIFDEPTTGLHFHDIKTLLQAFQALIKRGHSVLVIEHNLEVIKCADWIIDLGPEGGERGGELVFAGTPEEIIKCKKSSTGKYLSEKL